jgi:hypothetical protein
LNIIDVIPNGHCSQPIERTNRTFVTLFLNLDNHIRKYVDLILKIDGCYWESLARQPAFQIIC